MPNENKESSSNVYENLDDFVWQNIGNDLTKNKSANSISTKATNAEIQDEESEYYFKDFDNDSNNYSTNSQLFKNKHDHVNKTNPTTANTVYKKSVN